MFELFVLAVSGFTNAVLGLAVYVKNPKSATSRLFLMLTTSFVLWSIVNYISLHPVLFSQVVWVRLVLFCAALLCLSVFLTFTVFPSTTMTGSVRLRKIAIGYTVFVMMLVLTPFVFVEGQNGEPTPSPGIGFFTLLIISLLGTGVYTLFKKLRRSSGHAKSQIRLMVIGLAATFGLIFISNFLLVVTYNFTNLIALGPAYTLIFSGTVAYAIVKHHLFDIRTAVARSVAYLLTVAFMGTLYAGIVFGATTLLLDGANTDSKVQLIYLVVAVLLASSFQRIKIIFDKLSNKLFFRDAYDPQDFLNELNEVLVEKIDLEPLLTSSINIIEKNLKVSNPIFVINPTAYFPQRRVGVNQRLTPAALEDIEHHSINVGQKVIVAETLENNHADLRKALDKREIAIAIRLVATIESQTVNMGALFLGPKRSGELFTKEDIRTLEIITNELVIAIQNVFRFEEIEMFNATLQDKVDDATRKLRRSNEKLQALDETKDEFISMASHQLRTPLTSVKGYVSMVLEGDAGQINDMQRKLLEQAFASSQRMVFLIADLLNLSRLRTGKFIIEANPSNLAEVIQGEVEQLKEAAASRNLKLVYKKPETFPTLLLDETKIRQVIMNFVDNAIYYTPSGGTIEIKLAETKSSVEFTVHDNGIGVPKSEQHHLFNKFYRAGNAQKARPDGTGLGLFMAKKVVVAQGGAIIFHSTEGKGSTFGFTFSKEKLKVPVIEPVNSQKVAEKETTPA